MHGRKSRTHQNVEPQLGKFGAHGHIRSFSATFAVDWISVILVAKRKSLNYLQM